MCFFVEINLTREELSKKFNVPARHDPRYMPGYYKAAFTKPFLPVITSFDPGIINFYRWGLIPGWVRDDETASKISNSTYNARGESVWEKPSFRNSIRQKRCMVLSHGFFEWHTGKDGKKIPFYIKRADNQPFAFAGIYDNWTNKSTGELVDTFSIITTKANELLAKIHNSKKRMPVILPGNYKEQWIDRNLSKNEIQSFINNLNPVELTAYTISRKILNKDLDISDPDIIQKTDYPDHPDLFK